MLYIGQTHTIAVPLMLDGGDGDAVNLSRANTRAAFETVYEKTFGRILPGAALKVLNFRVAVIGVREKFDLARLAVSTEATNALPRETRSVWIDGSAHAVPVYERLRLPIGAIIKGPALFEQSDTTVWLESGFVAQVDALGNLLLSRALRLLNA